LVPASLKAFPVVKELAMQRVNAIGWFDLYVEDMERALGFYQAVLQQQLEPMGDPTGETVMYAFVANMSTYGAAGALVQSAHARPGVGGTMIYFNVADCSVEQARVASAGGKVLRPKFSIGEFGWVAVCMDTEGNLFGLSSMR
jgi:predicted enzyme related to lactoylglutathione lyase